MSDITVDKDVIDFNVVPGKKKFVCPLLISNNSSSPIIFKIKTTNNQRYAVKPSMGCVPENSATTVSIILIADFVTSLKQVSDKFQMQWLTVASSGEWSEDQLNSEWKVNKGKEQKKILPVSVKDGSQDFSTIPEVEKESEMSNKKSDNPVFQSALNSTVFDTTNFDDKDKMLEQLREEKNKMESELAGLRANLESTESKETNTGFTAVHMLVVMAVSLFVGYWFG